MDRLSALPNELFPNILQFLKTNDHDLIRQTNNKPREAVHDFRRNQESSEYHNSQLLTIQDDLQISWGGHDCKYKIDDYGKGTLTLRAGCMPRFVGEQSMRKTVAFRLG